MAVPQDADTRSLHFLATEGYLPLALADHPGMVEAYRSLFEKSSQFFALPEDSPHKTTYQASSGPAASEEGYSKIPSEKSIMTVKWAGHCPEILHDTAKTVWDLSGEFLDSIMQVVARTLALEPDVFDSFIKPCLVLPKDERTPTLMRMFRYDRPPGPDPIVNAERHKDLGILSLVVAESPGLHVLSPPSNQWLPIEEEVCLPPGTRVRSGGLTATLLVGETLTFLTRGQYRAGAHGVVCNPPSPENGNNPFRYSIVYTLRPAEAPVHTMSFESAIVGQFFEGERMEGSSSKDLFGRILNSHYNVNVSPEIREKQKLDQQKARERQAAEKAKVDSDLVIEEQNLTMLLGGRQAF